MKKQKSYTPSQLDSAIKDYFSGISATQQVQREVWKGEYDKMGRLLFVPQPVYNDAGQAIRCRVFYTPPSVEGLCSYLDISRETWDSYAENIRYSAVIMGALGVIRAYLKERLLDPECKNIRGVMFELENNYGYATKNEVELGKGAKAAVTAANIPLSEREELLKKLVKEFAEEEES